MVFKGSSNARWTLPSAWAPDIREVAQQYRHSNASSSGGTASGSSSGHHTSKPHSHHRSSDEASIMDDISEGLEVAGKAAKVVGSIASTTAMVAGTGCAVM